MNNSALQRAIHSVISATALLLGVRVLIIVWQSNNFKPHLELGRLPPHPATSAATAAAVAWRLTVETPLRRFTRPQRHSRVVTAFVRRQ